MSDNDEIDPTSFLVEWTKVNISGGANTACLRKDS